MLVAILLTCPLTLTLLQLAFGGFDALLEFGLEAADPLFQLVAFVVVGLVAAPACQRGDGTVQVLVVHPIQRQLALVAGDPGRQIVVTAAPLTLAKIALWVANRRPSCIVARHSGRISRTIHSRIRRPAGVCCG